MKQKQDKTQISLYDKNNKHVEDYLNDYLKSDNPDFAVLLTGKWGCGKSHFIKGYLKDYKKRKLKFLPVSLYGLEKTEEIDRKIFLALHPKLDGQYTELLSHFAIGALSIIKADGVLKNFKSKDFIHAIYPKNKKYKVVLVFDDVERCHIPINRLLGYINSWVEHHGIYTIMIAHEKELDEKDEDKKVDKKPKKNNTKDDKIGKETKVLVKEKKTEYSRIKEKLIGKTLQIYPQVNEAVDSWHKQDNLIFENKNRIIDIFKKMKCENIRSLKRGIYEAEIFFDNISPKYNEEKDTLLSMIENFFYLWLDNSRGHLEDDNYSESLYYFLGKGKCRENYSGKLTDKNIFLQVDTNGDEICWKYIRKGILEKEKLNNHFESSYLSKRRKEDPLAILKNKFFDISDEEYKEYYNELILKIQSGDYKHQLALLNAAGILVYHKERLFGNELTNKGISDLFKTSLAKVGDELIPIQENDRERLKLTYKYKNEDSIIPSPPTSKLYDKLYELIQAKVDSQADNRLMKFAKALENSFKEKPEECLKLLGYPLSDDSIYYKTPILKHLDPEKMAMILVDKPDAIRTFWYMLNERYSNINYKKEMFEEIPFLENFNDEINKIAKTRIGKPSKATLESISHEIKKLINQLKEFKKQNIVK